MRVAYADPPYPGQAKRHYGKNGDPYAGTVEEVDHAELVFRLVNDFDGYCLHTSSPALYDVLERFAIECVAGDRPRIMAWVKPFAVFKRHVPVAYAWEPVLVKPCRKPVVSGRITPLRDWLSAPIVLNGGQFAGAKPAVLCQWLFEVMGCEPDDTLHDLYPGTGAVSQAWERWRNQLQIEVA